MWISASGSLSATVWKSELGWGPIKPAFAPSTNAASRLWMRSRTYMTVPTSRSQSPWGISADGLTLYRVIDAGMGSANLKMSIVALNTTVMSDTSNPNLYNFEANPSYPSITTSRYAMWQPAFAERAWNCSFSPDGHQASLLFLFLFLFLYYPFLHVRFSTFLSFFPPFFLSFFMGSSFFTHLPLFFLLSSLFISLDYFFGKKKMLWVREYGEAQGRGQLYVIDVPNLVSGNLTAARAVDQSIPYQPPDNPVHMSPFWLDSYTIAYVRDTSRSAVWMHGRRDVVINSTVVASFLESVVIGEVSTTSTEYVLWVMTVSSRSWHCVRAQISNLQPPSSVSSASVALGVQTFGYGMAGGDKTRGVHISASGLCVKIHHPNTPLPICFQHPLPSDPSPQLLAADESSQMSSSGGGLQPLVLTGILGGTTVTTSCTNTVAIPLVSCPTVYSPPFNKASFATFPTFFCFMCIFLIRN